ncbi:MAG: TRAP transporter large permease subunit, partial [Desulfofustis sp.]|nr:TRAP transporter large permease subunit [Desulfofustis sp.]
SITDYTTNQYLIVFLMLAILMVAGCVMETTPNIVILSPLLLPLALEIGMHEIHFCIFMITALGIGFITPPLGLNLFVVSGVTGASVMEISRYAVTFVFTMLIVVLILAFVPALSLWLL